MYLHGGDWRSIREALKTIGAPITAGELGIEDKHIIEALMKAHNIRPERYTILGDKDLPYEAAVNIARTTRVIE
jgi:glycerol-1-phosphate dehydrogenase [NAD(P)+]